MRIALITADFAPNVGGVAAHVVELGKALAAAGHAVHVITRPLGDMAERQTRWQGMTVLRPRLPRAEFLYNIALAHWLGKFLRQTPVDVLHVHGLRPLIGSRGRYVPVVFTNHTSGYLRRLNKGPRERRRLAARLAHVAHVLAPSEELCEATRAVGYPGPVTFIPNGVDVQRFHPGASSLRWEWGIADHEVAVLLARRLVDKNGVTVFAEAVAALRDMPVRLVFAGDGPERAKVEGILQANGMIERALLLGNVANDSMPDVYNAADISVLPSYMEATSISGLESMACGLPLVGTAVGGIPVLIDDGVTGRLVPPGDPPVLGAALRELVGDAELRRRMGQAARDKAVEQFSWSTIAARTAEIYAQAAGGRT
jgi:glycosyltransferase involved in cell wall biosynthesis